MTSTSSSFLRPAQTLLLAALFAVSCAGPGGERDLSPIPEFPCDADNGGIELPAGFCATVFADGLGVTRHLVVNTNGDVYVARELQRRREEDGGNRPGGVMGLRDTDGDGKADVMEDVVAVQGSGVALHDGYLYYSSSVEVFRVQLSPGDLQPVGEPVSLVAGFLEQNQHATKPMDFDDAGNMYVTVGSPSNACQEEARTAGSPGQDPCPQRDLQAGIWQFDAALAGQVHGTDGTRYAAGIRNGFAMSWNADAGGLYTTQHGRDALSSLYPDLYTPQQSADLPAEEMFRVDEGDDFGWPYCYWDAVAGRKILAPEYGGDGQESGRCAEAEAPIVAFPAHWAPNDMIFYRDGTFPERYDGGAFVAFHGSWNRGPFGQQGYRVVFVPFTAGMPSGEPEDFAVGFPQVAELNSSRDAVYRPTGLAQGPDGSLYVTDSRQGRIWRIRAISAE